MSRSPGLPPAPSLLPRRPTPPVPPHRLRTLSGTNTHKALPNRWSCPRPSAAYLPSQGVPTCCCGSGSFEGVRLRRSPTAAFSRRLLDNDCVVGEGVSALLSLLLRVLVPLLVQLRWKRRGRLVGLKKVPHVLLALSLLTATPLPVAASPWVQESGNSVKLRARYCQPVPDQQLRSMLGAAFDPDRMASDDPHAVGGGRGGWKRSDPAADGLDPEMEDTAFEAYYMSDDHGGSYGNDKGEEGSEEDFRGVMEERGRFWEGGGWYGVDSGREGGDEDGLEKEESFYHKKDVGWNSPRPSGDLDPGSRVKVKDKDKPPADQHYLYMKRRRRAVMASRRSRNPNRRRRSDSPGPEDATTADSDETSSVDKRSRDSLLPLRLFLSGRNRKLRQKLKKAFRKKARKLQGQKAPPWACGMSKAWGRLKEGYFPRYLLDGRCVTDRCFYRLYTCVPHRYRVKVLKRDPDYCNPLPIVGLNTTYEQKWSVVRYYVTVGCNCEAPDPLRQHSGLPRRGRYDGVGTAN